MFKLKIVTDKRTEYGLAKEILLQDERLEWVSEINFFKKEAVIRTAYEKEGEDWKLVSDTGFTEKLIFLQIDDEIVIGGTKHGN